MQNIQFVNLGNFDDDMRFTETHANDVRKIIAPYVVKTATSHQDRKEATDFICRDLRLASRIRRPGFSEKHRYEFTVRSARASGTETELSKIMSGYADWMFYGHENLSHPNGIDPWYIIDLDVFRQELNTRWGTWRWDVIDNQDGTTQFMAFDLRTFSSVDKLVIGASLRPSYNAALGFGRMIS